MLLWGNPVRQCLRIVVADADVLRQCMVEGLARRDELDKRWRAAFTEVPRHEFIPELVWCHDRDTAPGPPPPGSTPSLLGPVG